MNIRISVSLTLAITIFGVALWGCSNSSTPPSNGASNTLPAIPPAGSSLTKVTLTPGYPLDTSMLTVDSTTLTDPNSSGAKVLKYMEKTSIGTEDSTYQSIEPNGDVGLKGESWDESGNFYVLPFATTNTIDSSYNGPAGIESLIAVHNGAGAPYLLNGGSYSTDSATFLYILDMDTIQYHYTYIPSLGIIARMSEDGQSPSSYWISSYSPK